MEAASGRHRPGDNLRPSPLRIVGGERQEKLTPHTAALDAPPQAARERRGEQLFILVDLSGAVSPRIYQEMREAIAQTYWATDGSITLALRRAVTAASRHLFQHNLRVDPSERCYGGMVCVVIHDEDMFILRAGSAQACVLQAGHLVYPGRHEQLKRIGIGPQPEVQLAHIFKSPDDTLLLASSALIQRADVDELGSALLQPKLEDVAAGMERMMGAGDLTALIVRWIPEAGQAASEAPLEEAIEEEPETTPQPLATPSSARAKPRQPIVSIERKDALLEAGTRLKELGQTIIRPIGRGASAVGAWLIGLVRVLFWRMLPGATREEQVKVPPAKKRRAAPEENRALMMSLAIGLPILVAIIVALTYTRFGAEARVNDLVAQMNNEAELAKAAGADTEEARSHWEKVLELADDAARLEVGDEAVAELKAQAQSGIDQIDGVVRLASAQLLDFGSENPARRLIVHGSLIFVLDPAHGWVMRLTLNESNDGVLEGADAPVLVRTEQEIGEGKVGALLDLVWVEQGGNRLTSGPLIMEKDGSLISYDPAWESGEGLPQLRRFSLGVPPTGTPKVVGSYQGNFYVLDTVADDGGQVWRYRPRGDGYPDPPERYFDGAPPRPLASAIDMAIDGYIYILYDDGEILKFLGGKRTDFEMQGVPGDLDQVASFAVDAVSRSGVVYVADRGNRRVVTLAPDGSFRNQFYARGGAFDALEALAVDEAAGRLYTLSGGRIYAVALP